MLDIGWTELLVIAVVLIVVVGPKDLPPMLRAFGKMMTRLRATAGEFRSQFDAALKEADMEDVSRTIGDARKLNPMNSLREAINPLRQTANEIRSDLQKAATSTPVTSGSPEPAVSLDTASAPSPVLDSAQPQAVVSPVVSAPATLPAVPATVELSAVSAPVEKPKRKSRAAVATSDAGEDKALAKPKRQKKEAEAVSAPAKKTATKKTAAAKKPPVSAKKDEA